jgi:hypothetical protein
MEYVPMVFVLLSALSICAMFALAASMRAVQPPPMPDLSQISRQMPPPYEYRFGIQSRNPQAGLTGTKPPPIMPYGGG